MRTRIPAVEAMSATKPLHLPMLVKSSSMAVNRQAVASAAIKTTVIVLTYSLNITLSTPKVTPGFGVSGVHSISTFA